MRCRIKDTSRMDSVCKARNWQKFFLSIAFGFLCLAATPSPSAAQQERVEANGARSSEAPDSFAPLSVSFNGTDARLTVQHSESLNVTGALTIETWMKPANLDQAQTLIERFGESTNPGGYGLRVVSNQIIFTICPAQSKCAEVYAKVSLAPNGWQHIAAVYDGDAMQIYINGQLAGRGRQGALPPGAAGGQMRIGANAAGTQMYQGLLDEIRISKAALYSSNFAPAAQLDAAANTVALWRFDGGTSNDATTNNNHAAMSGGAGFSPDVPVVPVEKFRITPTPNVGPSNNLYGVKTISPAEVWAVGDHGPAGFCCFPKTPVSLRWNGSQWVNIPVPVPAGTTSASLVAVDATSSTNV